IPRARFRPHRADADRGAPSVGPLHLVGIEAFGRRRRRGYRGHARSAPIVRFLLAARIVGIETGLRAVRFHDTKRAARDGGAKFGRVADTTAALAFRLLLANAGV